jgi:hypothetical protein
VAAIYWSAEYSLIRDLKAEERPPEELGEGPDRPLDIVVLHLSDSSTLRALKTARTLASELSARVHLLAPHIVPYPLSLNAPQVPVSFTANRLREIAAEAGVEVTVDIVLCRDLMTTLSVVLKPHSLIVTGEHRPRWRAFQWLDRECRLAQRLRKLGHQVLSADLN